MILDICIKSDTTGTITLVERWIFTLTLGESPTTSSTINAGGGVGTTAQQQNSIINALFKRLCIMIRTLRSLILALPSHAFLRLGSGGPNMIVGKSQEPATSLQEQQIRDLRPKGDYKINFKRESLNLSFSRSQHQSGAVKRKELKTVSN